MDFGWAVRVEVETGNGAEVCGVPRGHGQARIGRGSVTDGRRGGRECSYCRSWRWLDCRKGWRWGRGRGQCKARGCRRDLSPALGWRPGRWCDCQLDWSPPSGAGGQTDPFLKGRHQPLQLQMLLEPLDLPHYQQRKMDLGLSHFPSWCQAHWGEVIISE